MTKLQALCKPSGLALSLSLLWLPPIPARAASPEILWMKGIDVAPTHAAAFSPNSEVTVVLSSEQFHLLDGGSGASLYTHRAVEPQKDPSGNPLRTTSFNVAAFSGDGAVLATGHGTDTVRSAMVNIYLGWVDGGDFMARLWNPEDGTILQALKHEGPVRALAFSADGNFLVTGSGSSSVTSCYKGGCSTRRVIDNRFRIWQVSNGQVYSQGVSQPTEVRAVALSPDGKWVATGEEDGSVKLWPLALGRVIPFRFRGSSVRSLAFSRDGQTLLSVHTDDMIRYWRAEDGQFLREMPGLDISRDGSRIARRVGSVLQIVRAGDGQVLAAYDQEVEGIAEFSFAPDGDHFSYLRADGQLVAARITPPLIGDVNGDSSVTVADAVLLLQYLVGMPTASPFDPAGANVDGSSGIDVLDVVAILRLALGVGGR